MGATYESVEDLAESPPTGSRGPRRAREADREADPDWPDWYALYMVKSTPARSYRRE